LTDVENPYYSHYIRWNNTSQIKKFLKSDFGNLFNDGQIYDELSEYIDPEIGKWHPFARAQYLELQLFMSGYLLSSQGDRMMMGHSVEGRFPFLDHRVIEFAATIPPKYKMNVLNEKYILKKTFGQLLPDSVINRDKQPYRAPISKSLLHKKNKVVNHLMSKEKLDSFGYFNPLMVERLLKKANQTELSARDDMALVAIASLQLLHKHYIK
jgi:asparagine synthase (glutamine-hydrolysing)